MVRSTVHTNLSGKPSFSKQQQQPLILNLKAPTFCFGVDRKLFGNRVYKNNGIIIIMGFSCPSFPQTIKHNNKTLLNLPQACILIIGPLCTQLILTDV